MESKEVKIYNGLDGEINLSDLPRVKKRQLANELIWLWEDYDYLSEQHNKIPKWIRRFFRA